MSQAESPVADGVSSHLAAPTYCWGMKVGMKSKVSIDERILALGVSTVIVSFSILELKTQSPKLKSCQNVGILLSFIDIGELDLAKELSLVIGFFVHNNFSRF